MRCIRRLLPVLVAASALAACGDTGTAKQALEIAENVVTFQTGTTSELRDRRDTGPFREYDVSPDEMLEVLPGLGTPKYDPVKVITFHTRTTAKFYGDDYAGLSRDWAQHVLRESRR